MGSGIGLIHGKGRLIFAQSHSLCRSLCVGFVMLVAFLISGLESPLSPSSSSSLLVCSLCVESGSLSPGPASFKCVDCDGDRLCADCAAAHRKQRLSRSHQLEPLDGTSRKCRLHPKQPIDSYCVECRNQVGDKNVSVLPQ